MSGHSKWSTIKRQKESKDALKGKLFSKLAKAISVAAKLGGSTDPETNAKLRVAIEAARAADMPKENIQRAIKSAISAKESLDEVSYEGFGPEGVGVIVDVATNNKNRTSQEIKNIFERAGGNLAGPGSVSFNFEPVGFIAVEKMPDIQNQMLKLIDANVVDLEETEDAIEVYTLVDRLSQVKEKIQNSGFNVLSFELIKKPKSLVAVNDISQVQKVINFLNTLEEHEDVQKVSANIDIPQEVLNKIEK